MAVSVYVAWSPVQIGYHRYSLDKLHDEMYSSSSGDTPDDLAGFLLEVWDVVEHQPEWDAFVQKYNVPNFMKQYASTTADLQNGKKHALVFGKKFKS